MTDWRTDWPIDWAGDSASDWLTVCLSVCLSDVFHLIFQVPGKTYVYRLNKCPLTCEPGTRKSPQVKSATQGNTASNITTIRECWSRPVVPMSCCPHCLCPRFLPSTTPSSGVGRKILCQIVDPSLKQLVLPTKKTPSPTSIPVSVIQKTTTSKIDH